MSPREKTEARLPRHLHNRFIASELLRIRERSGLSGEKVASRVGWSSSKVSRIERGISPFDGEDLRRYLPVIKATREEIRKILTRAADPEADEYEGALSVLEWATTALPGAVQCPAYAWALETAQNELVRREPKAAEAAVATSLHWQDVALQGALRIEVIFDESALARQYGGPGVMSNQLAHMLALGSQENVSIRMVPMTASGLPVVSSFLYVKFPGEHTLSGADTVLLRQPAGEAQVVQPRETYHYHFAWEHLRHAAACEETTARAIEETLQHQKGTAAA